jgi:hypothetical protein
LAEERDCCLTRLVVYRRGDVVEAEPAVPSWRMPVAELFTV